MALCDGVTVYGFGNGGKAYQYYKVRERESAALGGRGGLTLEQ